ncbi:MAG: YtxH domain-containing protein [Gemmatimonadaceae bacterium]|nr:YtxH domain-containing protein [Gemmatimonadaceae bacterium]
MDEYDYDLYDEEPYLIVENREGSSIGPFIIGLALGAGIALLMAPQSGEETRRDIADKVSRAKDAARDAVSELGDVIGNTLEEAREKVETGVESAREAVDVRRRRVHTAVEAGRVAARQARADLELRLAESKAAHIES